MSQPEVSETIELASPETFQPVQLPVPVEISSPEICQTVEMASKESPEKFKDINVVIAKDLPVTTSPVEDDIVKPCPAFIYISENSPVVFSPISLSSLEDEETEMYEEICSLGDKNESVITISSDEEENVEDQTNVDNNLSLTEVIIQEGLELQQINQQSHPNKRPKMDHKHEREEHENLNKNNTGSTINEKSLLKKYKPGPKSKTKDKDYEQNEGFGPYN